MRETDLPYPGVITNGMQLRRECVKAISHIQTSLDRSTGKHSEADNLTAFFTACAAAVADAVAGTQPSNSVVPAITGTPTVGQVLTASTGTWAGTPTPTYQYAWYADNVAIAGASASTYTLKAAQAGKIITVKVKGSNTAGYRVATSAATAKVAAA